MKKVNATCYIDGHFNIDVTVPDNYDEEKVYELIDSYINLGNLEKGEYDIDVKINKMSEE